MSNRQIGTLTSPPPRTVGKFYQAQNQPPELDCKPTPPSYDLHEPKTIRSRTKSVGRIYNTRLSNSKERAVQAPSGKVNY